MKKRKTAYLQITRKCNNKCVFCSNPQFDKDYSFEEAKERVLQFKKEGVTEIILTGGEPTLCDFILDIIKFIKNKKLDLKIISNGVILADKSFVKQLSDTGLENLHISIHSHKEEVSDKLTQKPGHFGKTIKGIQNCINQGLIVAINTTINSKNCKHLDKFVSFMIKKFPEINHFIFNGLDPGNADGYLKSRAGKNPWIVPRLIDLELGLHRTADILRKNKKTFRIERVPLCYMDGFEEYSTETRKIIKDETYICSFIGKDNKVRKIKACTLREKEECCTVCKLNEVCAGIQIEYTQLYGKNELYPVFKDKEGIIRKVENEK